MQVLRAGLTVRRIPGQDSRFSGSGKPFSLLNMKGSRAGVRSGTQEIFAPPGPAPETTVPTPSRRFASPRTHARTTRPRARNEADFPVKTLAP